MMFRNKKATDQKAGRNPDGWEQTSMTDSQDDRRHDFWIMQSPIETRIRYNKDRNLRTL